MLVALALTAAACPWTAPPRLEEGPRITVGASVYRMHRPKERDAFASELAQCRGPEAWASWEGWQRWRYRARTTTWTGAALVPTIWLGPPFLVAGAVEHGTSVRTHRIALGEALAGPEGQASGDAMAAWHEESRRRRTGQVLLPIAAVASSAAAVVTATVFTQLLFSNVWATDRK
ncbi:MAG: hypothetical protein ACI8PZ_002034 [Myxococcota bacterium]|jgi:hypothetical protein